MSGRSVIDWVLGALESTAEVSEIVVGLSQATPERIADVILQRAEGRPCSCVTGRSWLEAVSLALESAGPTDLVLMHEPTRPLVASERFSALLAAARGRPVAAGAVPVKSTYKRVVAGRVSETVPRDTLFVLPGPWIFDRPVLEDAVHRAQRYQWSCVGELSLCQKAELPIALLDGDDWNLSVLTQADAQLAELLWQAAW